MSGAVLVLRALGLGDMLTAIPALRGVERAFPDRPLFLATPAELAPIVRLARIGYEVTDCPWLDTPDVPLPVDLAIDLHGRGPESHLALLALAPDDMIAFRNEDIWDAGPAWDPLEHEMSRWCRLLNESGVHADPSDFKIEAPNAAGSRGGVTVIHPGAKDAARRWPAERWAKVARSQAAMGNAVVVTGSDAERGLAEAIASAAGLGPGSVAAGSTTLIQLATLLAEAGLLVCGDTGVAHLATALGTPSVLLFGPTDPSAWGPPPGGPHRVLWKGRVGDPHGRTPDPGLLDIQPSEVVAQIAELRLLRV